MEYGCGIFRRMLSVALVLVLLFACIPAQVFAAEAEQSAESLAGKTISILGDSISTYTGVSNDTSVNATLSGGAVYYSNGTLGVSRADTWWQQTVDALDLELLVNNSWSGSCILHTRSGTVGAYVSRCQQLHNDKTGEEPDIIAVFLGTNDFSYYQSALGTADIDYAALIAENGDGTYTYAEPTTSCEAYAIMLHKMTLRYPDAEVYCMTLMPRRNPVNSGADVGQPTAFNAELTKIIEHFGCKAVALENCGITSEPANFDLYMGDKRVHPNAAGMDCMTQALVNALTGRQTELYNVSHKLNNIIITDENTRTVASGGSYQATLTEASGFEGITVTVTMGGQDITASVYSDGEISIKKVTGNIVVMASSTGYASPKTYRWEFDGEKLVSAGEDANTLTLLAGTVRDGKFSDVRYRLEKGGILSHDLPWVIEWKGAGSGGFMLSEASDASGGPFFFRRAGNYLYAFGDHDGSQYNNYGLALNTTGIDGSAEHVYRLENRVETDGSNMVYLYVDGAEVGALNNYYVGGSAQGTTGDWISGRDFYINYIGTPSHPLTNYAMEYLQIWEGGEPAEALAGKTISILGASISTFGGTSNGAAADTTNSTIRKNAQYYPHATVNDVTLNDTWWLQVAEDLDLRLLVNNSWSGSSLLHERSGTVGAYVDRCVQLHDDTGDNAGEEPDIIGIQMGTNDFQYYKDTLGTADIDYAALIKANDDGTYTYAEPTTSLEAAAIVLHKISVRYPDAEVYYLNISQRVDGSDELIRSFNEELKQVVEHFGAHIVDIYGSAITMENFSTYIGDGRVHPNKLGMDAYAEAFKRTLVANTAYDVIAHTVSFDLDGVTADYGDDKLVMDGDSFAVDLTANTGDTLKVTVTMGNQDITAAVCADGAVTIGSVTADVTITAKAVHEPGGYRWEFDGSELVCVSGDNALTKNAGTTTDGVFSKTRYALQTEVVLRHDRPWTVEWKCEGTFQNAGSSSGARIFTSNDVNANYNARYIFKSNTNGLLAMGEKTTSGSHNYGIALGDHNIDWTQLHTYRLENRIADDGSNMIWLYVDGAEIGPMTGYYIGARDQNTTSDWLSGKDFVFPFMGTDTHGFTNCSIDYIQVWENGKPDFAGKIISILSASTSTFAGYIPVADGFNLAHRARYPQDNLLTEVNETWWMQVIHELDAKLGINDSWAGSQVLNTLDTNSGDLGPDAAMASLTRIQNLGANGTPDVILFYGGGNDMGRGVALGSFDPNTAPTVVDLTATKWDSFADAYVAAIMRLQHFYPDTELVVIMSHEMPSYVTAAKLNKYGPVMKAICDHYGVPYVDLRDCGITFDMLPDNIHPNAEGMDYITADVLQTLLSHVQLEAGENVVYTVTHMLTNAKASKGYYKGVSAGKGFAETLTGEGLTVTVTMGGMDVTAEAYQDGKIKIPAVTGDVVITAKAAFTADGHLQQLPEEICAGTNLWTALEPENIYYTANGWGLFDNSPDVHSITFPVKAGERVWATSFGPGVGDKTAPGTRITWFDENGVLKTVDRYTVYNEFMEKGYVTVPEGAIALNVPAITGSEEWEVYLLDREHSYEFVVTEPTCTQVGYTTHTCTLCGDSYTDNEVTELGHTPTEGVRENETASGYELVTYCDTCGAELNREYVETYLPGDINGDGKVNNKDATRLFQYLSGWNVTVVEAALDVNGDGKVNNKDATRLFQYLSGWNVEIH